MVKPVYPWKGRNDRIMHYSTLGFLIEQEQTGNKYVEAVDIYPTRYTYVETDEPIEPVEPPVPEETNEQVYEWE